MSTQIFMVCILIFFMSAIYTTQMILTMNTNKNCMIKSTRRIESCCLFTEEWKQKGKFIMIPEY